MSLSHLLFSLPVFLSKINFFNWLKLTVTYYFWIDSVPPPPRPHSWFLAQRRESLCTNFVGQRTASLTPRFCTCCAHLSISVPDEEKPLGRKWKTRLSLYLWESQTNITALPGEIMEGFLFLHLLFFEHFFLSLRSPFQPPVAGVQFLFCIRWLSLCW